MTGPIRRLQKNPIFKYASSIKLAIPLLLIVAATVAWGTIIESRYNADLARRMVYQSDWFTVLLALLWLNIFCATVSRIPFKLHHLGFVITHIGLLTLLAGGMITSTWGIDGVLRVQQGNSENSVSLPQLVVGVAPLGSRNFQYHDVAQVMSQKSAEQLGNLNETFGHLFKIERYFPFTEIKTGFQEGGGNNDIALSFILRSQFFNVSEFLHSKLNPRMQMGPATLELTLDSEKTAPLKPVKATRSSEEPTLQILDTKSAMVKASITLKELQSKKRILHEGAEISLVRSLKFATVGQKGLEEGEPGSPNPALELQIKRGDKTIREVLFARFPDFSMNKGPASDIKFVYKVASGDSVPDAQNSAETPPSGQGNVIRFRVPASDQNQVQVELYKDGSSVKKQIVQPGGFVETPWMGMKVFVGSLMRGAQTVQDVKAIDPIPMEALPLGAIEIKSVDDESKFWIPEGESRTLSRQGREYEVYFGRKVLRLPFSLQLVEFTKKDYPGTETAMSYESDVLLPGETVPQKISMNEPLVKDGFTLYQSSYELAPGQPPVSIFSVNRDPGRLIKYWGALILCVGIIIFTVMRSSRYRQWTRRVS
ncbi:MAG: cytochrome c biogenesis protein ResB [Bdellovibrionia bacterium]